MPAIVVFLKSMQSVDDEELLSWWMEVRETLSGYEPSGDEILSSFFCLELLWTCEGRVHDPDFARIKG